ncbi:hypothetical protein CK203_032792 [Vitis vinifera]|uniref:DUF4283 domain-containing protein n=1 Tax=Vitis vinifera TaxID=29760 RepID=A0A438I8F9_VITVI|nr:hypothetical protein CK203_032792 [Vitis vinifera]
MRERESACDGDDNETGEASRKRSFTVESKTFELALDERKGKRQILIVEKKRGVSTWVRLGLESLGLFKEGLIHCIRDEKEGRWEKEWKERGKLYTLARGFNRAGGFLRLGVMDLERKRTDLQEVRTVGKATPAKSYAEAVMRTNRNGLNAIKMKVTREEIAGNLQKLEHCLIASWKSNKKEEEDLERLGSLWANSWGLKGKLGLAKLERGRALLEFEDLREAHHVVSSGSRVMGGAHLGLNLWNPETGCWVEEEMEQEAWVKIFGLPISLWNPGILKKIGEECGGFVEIDERTRSMGEIQWARILVKIRGDFRPSMLEIEVEEEVYTVALWWEIRPVVRLIFFATENRRRNEVRGDSYSSAEKRVGKELEDAGTEELHLIVDGSVLQENGPGLVPGNQIHGPVPRDWVYSDGRVAGSTACGPNMGLNELEKDDGRPGKGGPNCSPREGWLFGRFISRKGPISEDPLTSWVPEEFRREQRDDGFSMTDRALEEEAKRYVLISHPKGKWVMGTPLLFSSNSDRAPEGESFDRPGGIEEELWGDKSTWLIVYEGTLRMKMDPGSWERPTKTETRSFTGQRESVDSCPMKLKIIIWNVRGANDSSKRKIIKNYIRNQRVEPNVYSGNQDSRDVRGYCEKSGLEEIYRLESPKCGGGCGWHFDMLDKRVLDISDWEEGQFSLSCRFKTTENGVTWVFTGVYGPFTKVEREGMWEELGAIRGLWDDPWCLGGDFKYHSVSTRKEQPEKNQLSHAEICRDCG